MLFPQNQGLFRLNMTLENNENLSHRERAYVLRSMTDLEPMDIDNLMKAHLGQHTLFYVPSTTEIARLDKASADTDGLKDKLTAKLVMQAESVEAEIKALCALPTRFDNNIPRYKPSKLMKHFVRKVNF
jgi:hypothetical protein